MDIRTRTIPGAHEVPTPLVCVRAASDADAAAVSLSVDPDGVARGPLHRGDGPPYIVRDGHRVTAQAEQRLGLRSVLGQDGHLDRWMRRNPGRLPVAVTGCGNLGMNPGVLAWSEGWRGGVPGPVGGCLAIHASGRGHRATLDAPEDGDTWYVTGPDLVREGRPAVSPATTFADLRHLLLFPFVDPGEGPRLDFGYDHLLADPALCLRAAEGLVVDIPLRDTGAGGATVGGGPGREPLLEALGTKGYRASDHPGERGTYRLDRDRLAICFLEGIYPHHALALDAGGRPMSLLVGGLSNRAGVTVREFAEDLCGLGVEHAILLDNGGDVGLYLPRERRFVLRPAEPDRQELWPTTACLIWHR